MARDINYLGHQMPAFELNTCDTLTPRQHTSTKMQGSDAQALTSKGTTGDMPIHVQDTSQQMQGLCDHDGETPCEDCVLDYLTRQAEEQHTTKKDCQYSNFACSFCVAVFKTKFEAAEHVLSTHHREPKHKYETCHMGFSSQAKPDQHMDMLGHWRPKFSCKTCGRIFST